MTKKAYLVLQNGQIFEGCRFGADGQPTGELVFTTGMAGYVETLSDPSYYGQIVLQTFPLIGNYGMIQEDCESNGSALKAYIVREWCDAPSNFRSSGTVDAFLKDAQIPGLYGVDTRAVTRAIRESGVMNACIVDTVVSGTVKELSAYTIKDAVAAVSCKEKSVYPAKGKQRFHVAVLDCGVQRSILRALCERGCEVTLFPHSTTAEEIAALAPDGLLLSNGPGNPEENTSILAEVRKLLGKFPIFGISLGHQLLALAAGGKTEKLAYGHRGANQPVKHLKTGRVHITQQNHGYAVVADSLKGTAGRLSMVNVNDGTCEGVDYPSLNAFSVQFYPDTCLEPQGTSFLYNKFLEYMGGKPIAAQ